MDALREFLDFRALLKTKYCRANKSRRDDPIPRGERAAESAPRYPALQKCAQIGADGGLQTEFFRVAAGGEILGAQPRHGLLHTETQTQQQNKAYDADNGIEMIEHLCAKSEQRPERDYRKGKQRIHPEQLGGAVLRGAGTNDVGYGTIPGPVERGFGELLIEMDPDFGRARILPGAECKGSIA